VHLDLSLYPEVESFVPHRISAVFDGFGVVFFIRSSWQPEAHIAIRLAYCRNIGTKYLAVETK